MAVRSSATSSRTDTSENDDADDDDESLVVHYDQKCQSLGDCSVAQVLDHCALQSGLLHTHVHILTYKGMPLHAATCCYPVDVQWFKAAGDKADFQLIPGASHAWYTPTADDIGARLLAKIMIHDEDVVKSKMFETGPVKEGGWRWLLPPT